MKPIDLRIGNYINIDGELNEVTGISFNTDEGVWMIDDMFNIEICNPIPLTEKWLLDFGFRFKLNEHYVNNKQWFLQVTGEMENNVTINKDYVWFDGIGDYSWLKKEGKKTMAVNTLCKGNYVCNSVGHVHELQNLYYALNGEELKI